MSWFIEFFFILHYANKLPKIGNFQTNIKHLRQVYVAFITKNINGMVTNTNEIYLLRSEIQILKLQYIKSKVP